MKIVLFLAGDRDRVSEAMSSLDGLDVDSRFESVTKADAAVGAIEKHNPDIVVFDHSLSPGGSQGMVIASTLFAKWPPEEREGKIVIVLVESLPPGGSELYRALGVQVVYKSVNKESIRAALKLFKSLPFKSLYAR